MVTIDILLKWFAESGNECIPNNVDGSQIISKPWAIDLATEEHISFIGSKHQDNFQGTLDSAKCKILIVSDKLLTENSSVVLPEKMAVVVSSNPKFDLIAMCNVFFSEDEKSIPRIHASAVVSDKATLGKNVQIGPNVVVEDDVIIGHNCIIDAGVVLKRNTQIGNNCSIGASTVIGGVGFGYSKNGTTQAYEQFPHYGGVILGNDVSVGGNSCIDRGSLSNTTIGDGVKIDNLVHIAHNVIIGKNSLVIALAIIGGSAKIGENCWVAPNSCIRNGITIGDDVTVGLSATVTKNVANGLTVVGSPASEMEQYLQMRSNIKNLGKG